MIGWIGKIKSRIHGIDNRVLLTVSAFLLTALIVVFVFGYLGPKKSDLRGSVPADSLAYLYIGNVGSVFGLISENAANKPKDEYAFLNGMEVAVAVTGFETFEEELTERASVLNVRPTFAAIAETNAWSWQLAGFIDGPLSEFIRKEYGKSVKREVQEGEYGNIAVWSSEDGRRSYALVEGSRIFFGNDLGSLESCVSASRGSRPNLLDDENLGKFHKENSDAEILGYFPRRAVEAFADVAGVSAAVSGSEQEGIRMFIARLVPQLFRNSVEEVFWTSRNTDGYFEDSLQIVTRNSISEVFAETMKPQTGDWDRIVEFIPKDIASLTRYKLRNPRIAYRSLLLLAAKSSDPVSGKLISAFSDSMLQPYGVIDAEAFLDAVGPELVTVQTDGADEASAAIVMIRDRDAVLDAIKVPVGTIKEKSSAEGIEMWLSEDKSTAAAIARDILVIGDREVVISSVKRDGNNSRITRSPVFETFQKSDAAAVTLATDDGNEILVGILNGTKSKNGSYFLSETTFSKTAIVRRYKSRFGLIGDTLEGFGR